MIKKIKDVAGRLQLFRKNDHPKALYDRYFAFLVIALCVTLFGVIMLFLPFPLSFSLVLIGAGIAIFVIAVNLKYHIEHSNYLSITGEVTFIKNRATEQAVANITRKDIARPAYYHVRCAETGSIYYFPVGKRAQEIPVGSTITFYYPKHATSYTRNNIVHISPIWAYDVADEDVFITSESGKAESTDE